jgi:hypothetical protein
MLFLNEIEQDKEVFISKEININNLPKSFRYYDFIVNYIISNLDKSK